MRKRNLEFVAKFWFSSSHGRRWGVWLPTEECIIGCCCGCSVAVRCSREEAGETARFYGFQWCVGECGFARTSAIATAASVTSTAIDSGTDTATYGCDAGAAAGTSFFNEGWVSWWNFNYNSNHAFVSVVRHLFDLNCVCGENCTFVKRKCCLVVSGLGSFLLSFKYKFLLSLYCYFAHAHCHFLSVSLFLDFSLTSCFSFKYTSLLQYPLPMRNKIVGLWEN